MSVQIEEFEGDEQHSLKEALITARHLSGEDVARIEEAAKAMHLSFAEASVHIGIVARRDLDETLAWARHSDAGYEEEEADSPSIVEVAIRSVEKNRSVVPTHANKVKPGRQLQLMHDPQSPSSERMRGLRTELLMLGESRSQASVLALLSPGASEGRSLVTAELAIAFAQLGRRTLLVDCDLRQPSQHKLFDADNALGLARSLLYSEPPRVWGVEGVPHLSLITAGPPVPNPLELLSDGRFKRMLGDWRRFYEFIFFDTPPVGMYTDGLAIANLAGRVLVLSRAAVTKHREMKDMLRRLGSTQARIMGAVMNHF